MDCGELSTSGDHSVRIESALQGNQLMRCTVGVSGRQQVNQYRGYAATSSRPNLWMQELRHQSLWQDQRGHHG